MESETNPPAYPIGLTLDDLADETCDDKEFLKEARKLLIEGGCTLESFLPELKRRAGVE